VVQRRPAEYYDPRQVAPTYEEELADDADYAPQQRSFVARPAGAPRVQPHDRDRVGHAGRVPLDDGALGRIKLSIPPFSGDRRPEDYLECDEDIPSIDTPAAPTAEHIQGPITRARAKQLNYQVLLLLGTLSHIHENMMLPKSDMFVTLRNDGPSTDERDKHWSMIVHGDGSKRLRMEEDATSGYFRTLKPP
jgi:hypothetical protein